MRARAIRSAAATLLIILSSSVGMAQTGNTPPYFVVCAESKERLRAGQEIHVLDGRPYLGPVVCGEKYETEYRVLLEERPNEPRVVAIWGSRLQGHYRVLGATGVTAEFDCVLLIR